MSKPSFDKENVLKGIHSGKITPGRLPEALYMDTAKYLNGLVDDGYGDTESDEDEEMMDDLSENIYMFSAAKTFQQVNEMYGALIDKDGGLLDYAAFALIAGQIFDRYNDAWLYAESTTAEYAAKSASDWMDFKESIAENPYLMYEAELDDHTCEICEPLDGILIDMDDSFWDDNATPQHFDCRCRVVEVKGIGSDAKNAVMNKGRRVSTPTEIARAVSKSHLTKNKMFNYNPGKARVIFPDTGKHKHPYFDVPDQFIEFAKENFGLPIPKKLQAA